MRTTPTQICWTKAILGRACHPMPLGKNLACDKFNHGSLTKDAVVHHIEPWLLTQPRWGIQSRSRWQLTKYWSKKRIIPSDCKSSSSRWSWLSLLSQLFHQREGMDHPAGANTSTEYLTFAHPSSNSLRSIYQYSPPDSKSNFCFMSFLCRKFQRLIIVLQFLHCFMSLCRKFQRLIIVLPSASSPLAIRRCDLEEMQTRRLLWLLTMQ